MERLSKGSAAVKQLAEPFDMSLPAVMQHLQLLEASKLVVSRKHGRVRTYSLNKEAMAQAEKWIVNRRQTWETMMDRMVEVVEAGED